MTTEPQGPTTLRKPERELFASSPAYQKVGIVHARQAMHDGSVETPEGVMTYHSGDYIVSDDPPTHLWPVRRDIFERTYQPAEARRKELAAAQNRERVLREALKRLADDVEDLSGPMLKAISTLGELRSYKDARAALAASPDQEAAR